MKMKSLQVMSVCNEKCRNFSVQWNWKFLSVPVSLERKLLLHIESNTYTYKESKISKS